MKPTRILFDTLVNELENQRSWEFDESPVGNVYTDFPRAEITLQDGRKIGLVVEKLASDAQRCGTCKKVKSGWPHDWGNVALGKGGANYVCANCFQKHQKKEIDQVKHEKDIVEDSPNWLKMLILQLEVFKRMGVETINVDKLLTSLNSGEIADLARYGESTQLTQKEEPTPITEREGLEFACLVHYLWACEEQPKDGDKYFRVKMITLCNAMRRTWPQITEIFAKAGKFI